MRAVVLGLVASLVACDKAPPTESGAPTASAAFERPAIGPEHTRCDTDDDCHLWSAEYSVAGCCPAACDGREQDPIAINREALSMLDRHCYDEVVRECDHGEAKIDCGPQPRVAACVEGTCSVRERGAR
jgi:hypothetical protein